MALDNEKLQLEQQKLRKAMNDKDQLHQETQDLYDRLKWKEMTAATQSAALDSVHHAFGSMANRQDSNQPTIPLPYQSSARPHTIQPGFSPSRMDYGGQQQLHNHHHRGRLVGSNRSNSAGQMMPPQPIRGAGFSNRDFGSGQPSLASSHQLNPSSLIRFSNQHRPQQFPDTISSSYPARELALGGEWSKQYGKLSQSEGRTSFHRMVPSPNTFLPSSASCSCRCYHHQPISHQWLWDQWRQESREKSRRYKTVIRFPFIQRETAVRLLRPMLIAFFCPKSRPARCRPDGESRPRACPNSPPFGPNLSTATPAWRWLVLILSSLPIPNV